MRTRMTGIQLSRLTLAVIPSPATFEVQVLLEVGSEPIRISIEPRLTMTPTRP